MWHLTLTRLKVQRLSKINTRSPVDLLVAQTEITQLQPALFPPPSPATPTRRRNECSLMIPWRAEGVNCLKGPSNETQG